MADNENTRRQTASNISQTNMTNNEEESRDSIQQQKDETGTDNIS